MKYIKKAIQVITILLTAFLLIVVTPYTLVTRSRGIPLKDWLVAGAVLLGLYCFYRVVKWAFKP